jgi:uncharacterized protein (TIGR02145 family)
MYAQWNTLIGYLDPSFSPNAQGSQSALAGGMMKNTGTQYWQSPNTDATNESGFTGLPGGLRDISVSFPFDYIGSFGLWWSSTGSDAANAWLRELHYDHGEVRRSNSYKTFGLSVRCLRD